MRNSDKKELAWGWWTAFNGVSGFSGVFAELGWMHEPLLSEE